MNSWLCIRKNAFFTLFIRIVKGKNELEILLKKGEAVVLHEKGFQALEEAQRYFDSRPREIV